MYIRFVCAAPHPYAAGELGLYRGFELIDWDRQPGWLADEFDRASEVFFELAVPPCVSDWRGTADGRRSLCWLRSENRERVARFRHLAWVMGEMGVPVAEIGSRDPGRIIYRDPDQVVALPRGPVRRAFPRRLRR